MKNRPKKKTNLPAAPAKEKPVSLPPEGKSSDYGGLRPRDLKKNLGCG